MILIAIISHLFGSLHNPQPSSNRSNRSLIFVAILIGIAVANWS
jgi:hypothetical protein